MNSVLGHGGLLLGFAAALVGAVTTGLGVARHRQGTTAVGRRYAWLILAGAVVATVALQRALIGHDFSLAYVAGTDSRATPLLYRITAMWSALQGSILLWCLALSVYVAALTWRFRRRAGDPLVGWATVAAYGVCAFFFGLLLFSADPFAHVAGAVPADGTGPNPLLQNNVLVAIHPVLLYFGYVGFTVPFAVAVGALATGRVGEAWLLETRRWTLVAWGSLTLGIVIGAWWSYQVLGWGGYWAWDPVENASLLPWLCGTAYLHSVVVQQRRGMLRVWNLSLLLATFSLTILGTFLTRSGVLQSVHAFSDSTLGPLIVFFFGAVVATGVALIGWRGDMLRSPGSLESPVSREGAFLANNVVFALFAFVVLLGTVFPLLVQALNGSQVSVGEPYFNRMGLPIALCLLFLMAVAPVLPWRRASGELLRSRLLVPAVAGVATVTGCVAAGLRGLAPLAAFGLAAFAGVSAVRQLALTWRRQGWRALRGRSGGGMIVHIGVVLLAVGFAASNAYSHRADHQLSVGQSWSVDGHTFTYLGPRFVTHPNRTVTEGLVQVDGRTVARPAVSQFAGTTQGIGTPWIISNAHRDLYLTLEAAPAGAGGSATIGVVVLPMVMWLWVGGAVMGAGVVLSIVPEGRRRRRQAPAVNAELQPVPDVPPARPAVAAR